MLTTHHTLSVSIGHRGTIRLDGSDEIWMSADAPGSDVVGRDELTFHQMIVHVASLRTLMATGVREPVVVCLDTAVDLAGVQNGVTLDGVSLTTGMRILLLSQPSPDTNGIYVVTDQGLDRTKPTPIDQWGGEFVIGQ